MLFEEGPVQSMWGLNQNTWSKCGAVRLECRSLGGCQQASATVQRAEKVYIKCMLTSAWKKDMHQRCIDPKLVGLALWDDNA